MHPTLQLGPLAVATHPFFVGLGVLVATVVVVLEAQRRAMWNDGMLLAITGGLVGGALGMHLSGVLRAALPGDDLAWHQAWQYGAKSILGGLTGAYIGVVIGRRLVGYRVRTGDVFAPAVAIGMAVGRVGCLLTEPPGRPTALPWGVTLTPEQAAAIPSCPSCAAGGALHPSFAYEIGFHLLAFGALLWLRSRLSAPGELLTLYLAAYAAFRFLVEFVRDNEVVLVNLTRGQLFLLAVAPLLCWRLVVSARAGHYDAVLRRRRALTAVPA